MQDGVCAMAQFNMGRIWVLCCYCVLLGVRGEHGVPRGFTPPLDSEAAETRGDEVRIAGDQGQGSIPGTPGEDYPIYAQVPLTSFKCEDHKIPGYYPDPETRCQAYHVCQEGGRSDSFLCPNGTLFHPRTLVCQWWKDVKDHCPQGIDIASQVNIAISVAQAAVDRKLRSSKYYENKPPPSSPSATASSSSDLSVSAHSYFGPRETGAEFGGSLHSTFDAAPTSEVGVPFHGSSSASDSEFGSLNHKYLRPRQEFGTRVHTASPRTDLKTPSSSYTPPPRPNSEQLKTPNYHAQAPIEKSKQEAGFRTTNFDPPVNFDLPLQPTKDEKPVREFTELEHENTTKPTPTGHYDIPLRNSHPIKTPHFPPNNHNTNSESNFETFRSTKLGTPSSKYSPTDAISITNDYIPSIITRTKIEPSTKYIPTFHESPVDFLSQAEDSTVRTPFKDSKYHTPKYSHNIRGSVDFISDTDSIGLFKSPESKYHSKHEYHSKYGPKFEYESPKYEPESKYSPKYEPESKYGPKYEYESKFEPKPEIYHSKHEYYEPDKINFESKPEYHIKDHKHYHYDSPSTEYEAKPENYYSKYGTKHDYSYGPPIPKYESKPENYHSKYGINEHYEPLHSKIEPKPEIYSKYGPSHDHYEPPSTKIESKPEYFSKYGHKHEHYETPIKFEPKPEEYYHKYGPKYSYDPPSTKFDSKPEFHSSYGPKHEYESPITRYGPKHESKPTGYHYEPPSNKYLPSDYSNSRPETFRPPSEGPNSEIPPPSSPQSDDDSVVVTSSDFSPSTRSSTPNFQSTIESIPITQGDIPFQSSPPDNIYETPKPRPNGHSYDQFEFDEPSTEPYPFHGSESKPRSSIQKLNSKSEPVDIQTSPSNRYGTPQNPKDNKEHEYYGAAKHLNKVRPPFQGPHFRSQLSKPSTAYGVVTNAHNNGHISYDSSPYNPLKSISKTNVNEKGPIFKGPFVTESTVTSPHAKPFSASKIPTFSGTKLPGKITTSVFVTPQPSLFSTQSSFRPYSTVRKSQLAALKTNFNSNNSKKIEYLDSSYVETKTRPNFSNFTSTSKKNLN